jgi:type I restriction enzyme S subunit
MSKDGLEGIAYVAPNNSLVQVFERLIYPIDQKIEVNEKESQVLKSLRDSLLPQLISGEIRLTKPRSS